VLDSGFGEVIAASRGPFAWRITVPADGRLNYDGIAPTLIQWSGEAHPCDGLEERGCTLRKIELRHPQAQRIERLFAALGLQAPTALRPGEPAIVARLDTPRGEVELA
jgi:hypothetical protein